MAVKIILCITAGSLLMIMLSVYKENHKKRNYPETVIVDGEIASADGGKPRPVHLEIRFRNEGTGGNGL